MKVGILAAGLTPDALRAEYPSYPDMFAQQIAAFEPDLSFSAFNVCLNEFPESTDECDAWLITGSKFDAYGDDPWIVRLCDLIREIDQKGQVLVGICFGHQVISRALGGKVEKSEKGWGIGIHHYQVMEAIPTLPDAKDVAFCAFHQDQVVEKPQKMRVFLRSDFCENAGFIYENQILTFQGHPEFSKAYENKLIDLYDGVTLTPELANQARQSVEQESAQSDQLMAWIARFLKRT